MKKNKDLNGDIKAERALNTGIHVEANVMIS